MTDTLSHHYKCVRTSDNDIKYQAYLSRPYFNEITDEQFSYQWWCVAKNNVTVIVTWAALIFVRARPTADNMLDLIDRRYATILSPH